MERNTKHSMEKWVTSCNPNSYDVIGAFSIYDSLDWKQSTNVNIGDIVYIYVSHPISAIKFETKAVEVDLKPYNIGNDIEYENEFARSGSNHDSYDRYMRLKLLRSFDDMLFPYEELKENGLRGIQGPTRVSSELDAFILNKINKNKYDEERESDYQLIDLINDDFPKSPDKDKTKYKPEPKKRSEPQKRTDRNVYPRDKNTAINALSRANYKCEIDDSHPSFIRKNTKINYVEPHHLIPLSQQDMFKYSLDVEANIVALCSNCHNQIHYGANSKQLIKDLYCKRKDELKQAGISISLEGLLEMYQV